MYSYLIVEGGTTAIAVTVVSNRTKNVFFPTVIHFSVFTVVKVASLIEIVTV